MAKRRVTIHRSGVRPHLFLGGDRELVLFCSAITFLLTVLLGSHGWIYVVLGLAFWALSLWAFRLAAKADPLMRFVYLRNRLYRKYYPARSQPWRVNRHDFTTPFQRRTKGT
jgi:type IV secretion system protein TrbD